MIITQEREFKCPVSLTCASGGGEEELQLYHGAYLFKMNIFPFNVMFPSFILTGVDLTVRLSI